MTSSELAEFVARVRRLFGGPMDEELFGLAKSRIAGLKAQACEDALSEYALMHGGSRMRFIPAKFFDFYLRRVDTASTESRSSRIDRAAEREVSDALEAERIAKQWTDIRSRIGTMDGRERDRIVGVLRGFGWQGPPAAIADWPSLWLLAVDDISLDRTVLVRDHDSGRWDVPISPVEFYRDRVPRPQDSSREAVTARMASESSLSLGGPRAAPAGSVDLRTVDPILAIDIEEIPF